MSTENPLDKSTQHAIKIIKIIGEKICDPLFHGLLCVTTMRR